jgi:hypothetical protein
MVGQLRLSRNQIARFVGNDPEAIKAIEGLFSQQTTNDTSFQDVDVSAGVANASANDALAQLQRIADTLDLIASAPSVELVQPVDWLEPVTQSHVKRNAYGWFWSTADQTAASINTAYGMTFNATGEAQDVRIGTPASRVYVERQGIYNIQFSAQFQNTAGGTHQAWVWLRVNGTDIANSATVLRIAGNNTEQVAAWNFLQRMEPGDYFELMWEVTDTSLGLYADPATAVHPAIPSVLLSVTDNISE